MNAQRARALRQVVATVARLAAARPADLDRYLVARLEALLRHAAATTPHYRQALAGAGWRAGSPLTAAAWRRIPLLERHTLHEHPPQLLPERVPQGCGPTRWIHTSGSTGRALRVRGTGQQAALWNAVTVCEHLEHARDPGARLAVIRVVDGPHGRPPDGSDLPHWGEPLSTLMRTGPAALLSIDADSRTQARWLARRDPHYLLTYPSNLCAIMDALVETAVTLPSLRQVRTVSEALGEDTRARCREQLGVELADVYSAVEVGYIATQVAGGEHYRCRNETVLVEVLDAEGEPAPVGEPGRVVVTALYSYAMPLIRYVLGDVAVASDRDVWSGAPRHLERIVGRRRNLFALPDGSRRWPRLGLRRMNALVRLRQVQMVQTDIDAVLLRVVCEHPLTAAERDGLGDVVRERFATVSRVTVEQVDGIARGPGGKFEEFLCKV